MIRAALRAGVVIQMINNPNVLRADEPTGNLDSKAAFAAMACFVKLNQENESTILMVTLDVVSASHCKEVLFGGSYAYSLLRLSDMTGFTWLCILIVGGIVLILQCLLSSLYVKYYMRKLQ